MAIEKLLKTPRPVGERPTFDLTQDTKLPEFEDADVSNHWAAFAGAEKLGAIPDGERGSLLELRAGVTDVLTAGGSLARLPLDTEAITIIVNDRLDPKHAVVKLTADALEAAGVDTGGGLKSAKMLAPLANGKISIKSSGTGWQLNVPTASGEAWTSLPRQIRLAFRGAPARMVSLDAEEITVDSSAAELRRLNGNVDVATRGVALAREQLDAFVARGVGPNEGDVSQLKDFNERLESATRDYAVRKRQLQAVECAAETRDRALAVLLMRSLEGEPEWAQLKDALKSFNEARKPLREVTALIANEGSGKVIEDFETARRVLDAVFEDLEWITANQDLQDEYLDAFEAAIGVPGSAEDPSQSFDDLVRRKKGAQALVDVQEERLEQMQARASERFGPIKAELAATQQQAEAALVKATAARAAFESDLRIIGAQIH